MIHNSGDAASQRQSARREDRGSQAQSGGDLQPEMDRWQNACLCRRCRGAGERAQ